MLAYFGFHLSFICDLLGVSLATYRLFHAFTGTIFWVAPSPLCVHNLIFSTEGSRSLTENQTVRFLALRGICHFGVVMSYLPRRKIKLFIAFQYELLIFGLQCLSSRELLLLNTRSHFNLIYLNDLGEVG